MRGQLIIWNKAKLDALEEAIRVAESGGKVVVIWMERDSASRWAKSKEHIWSLTEARHAADSVRAELRINPMPVLPENREGKEP
jgi:ubiquinone/menaquinone biosynthesis C-methylase UbiE